MNELNQTINYVALFGFGLCILALMVFCIAWVFGFIMHQIQSYKPNAKQRIGRVIRPRRTGRNTRRQNQTTLNT